MTHDDCRLWFAQLEDVFASLGISSQTNKFAALTTLLTDEEAYVVRDLTMMGDERPSNVFDAAMSLFVKRYELSVHQRITRALSMNDLAVDEKPSQWMARLRHAGGEWDREDVERSALLRHLPSSLRTTLELPTPQQSMDELLQKAENTVRHAALRDRFGHPGNANRTSGSRHLGRSTGRQCLVQET